MCWFSQSVAQNFTFAWHVLCNFMAKFMHVLFVWTCFKIELQFDLKQQTERIAQKICSYYSVVQILFTLTHIYMSCRHNYKYCFIKCVNTTWFAVVNAGFLYYIIIFSYCTHLTWQTRSFMHCTVPFALTIVSILSQWLCLVASVAPLLPLLCSRYQVRRLLLMSLDLLLVFTVEMSLSFRCSRSAVCPTVCTRSSVWSGDSGFT